MTLTSHLTAHRCNLGCPPLGGRVIHIVNTKLSGLRPNSLSSLTASACLSASTPGMSPADAVELVDRTRPEQAAGTVTENRQPAAWSAIR